MAGFLELPVHPDVPDGVRALRAAGHRLATLSNGAAEVAAGLLGRAGIRDQFEALLSVEDAGAWKPARAAYLYAADRLGVRPAEATLVAVHPWDIDGAARAGLRTAWINRTGAAYPAHLTSPERTVADRRRACVSWPRRAARLAVALAEPVGRIDVGDGLGERPGVPDRVGRRVLPLPVRVVGRLGDDRRAGGPGPGAVRVARPRPGPSRSPARSGR